MKIILTILLILFACNSQAQPIFGWESQMYFPTSYNQSISKFPAIVYVDTNTKVKGAMAFIEQGWNANYRGIDFVVVSLFAPRNASVSDINSRLEYLRINYKINYICLSGYKAAEVKRNNTRLIQNVFTISDTCCINTWWGGYGKQPKNIEANTNIYDKILNSSLSVLALPTQTTQPTVFTPPFFYDNKNEKIIVNRKTAGSYMLISLWGSVVKKGNLKKGISEINLRGLSSGSYYFVSDNSYKLIIK